MACFYYIPKTTVCRFQGWGAFKPHVPCQGEHSRCELKASGQASAYRGRLRRALKLHRRSIRELSNNLRIINELVPPIKRKPGRKKGVKVGPYKKRNP